MNLDVTPEQFREHIDQLTDIISELYHKAEERRVFPGVTPEEVQARFDEPLPRQGNEIRELLEKVRADVIDTATLNIGPRFYGYITGGGNQVAVLAEMIRTALNQNNLKWHSSPVSTELEKLVTRWLAEWMGYPTDCSGVLLAGGSVANFEALAVARKMMGPDDLSEKGIYGAEPMTVYVSAEGHSSFDKAMDILGLGREHLRKIPVDRDFRVRVDEMESQIERDRNNGLRPICAIGIAGTTNTGALDDLAALAELCRRQELWFHVDAAYGGPAAALTEKRDLFDGLDQADSLVVNPHKWLYVPFEASAIMVRKPENQRKTFSLIPDYLRSDRGGDNRTDLMEYNLPLTKDFKSLKVWMTIKGYGAERLQKAIQSDIAHASYLTDLIGRSPYLEQLAPAPLSIVCFRFNPGEVAESKLNDLNNAIIDRLEKDGRIFLTGTRIKGKTALRVCFINHRTEPTHVEKLVKVITVIGNQLYRG